MNNNPQNRKSDSKTRRWTIGTVATMLIALQPYWAYYATKQKEEVVQCVKVSVNHADVIEEMRKLFEKRMDGIEEQIAAINENRIYNPKKIAASPISQLYKWQDLQKIQRPTIEN